MKLKQLTALCLAASAFAAAPAMAWESADGQFSTSASVALSTDYMYRGVSQTDQEPAISGSFDVGHASGLYAGVWASNIDFDDADGNGNNGHVELNYYGGFASEYAGIGYDVGVLRYVFPGTDGLDWNEAYLGLSYSLFSLTISHSSDALASGENGTHYLLGFNYDLPMDIGFHANYAFYDVDDDIWDDTLEDYNLGITKNIAGFDFDLTYYETLSEGEDATEAAFGSDNRADSRFVFTISKSL